ncbi:hypothetical protein J7363_04745 [Phaeobacter italicus]|uniref:hypothetical protein n=1 Tax=Phaeobacter italicus TaxID=481446 RepID=UPI001ADC957F|nr:hypothetical protein [Phaeobacter italicus]MBO9441389.1 hypothetical protein [Phaeobacter italicus]
MSKQLDDDGYRVIPPRREQPQERGVKCGVCGMKFEHGRAYGFWCANTECPMQSHTTS